MQADTSSSPQISTMPGRSRGRSRGRDRGAQAANPVSLGVFDSNLKLIDAISSAISWAGLLGKRSTESLSRGYGLREPYPSLIDILHLQVPLAQSSRKAPRHSPQRSKDVHILRRCLKCLLAGLRAADAGNSRSAHASSALTVHENCMHPMGWCV